MVDRGSIMVYSNYDSDKRIKAKNVYRYYSSVFGHGVVSIFYDKNKDAKQEFSASVDGATWFGRFLYGDLIDNRSPLNVSPAAFGME